MIKDIKELNFPSYATLSKATCILQDMAEKTITTQVKIDGSVTPDFTYDWEIEFKGEKYIMPLRQPQAAKENTSLNSTIDLTFHHWAQYQLKRWYFFTPQPVQSGTAIVDKYIASVSLNLGNFCALFNQVLAHYFNGAITIDLNPKWEFAEEPTTIEISYSYLWDVLIQFYELWAVRWQIEPNGGTDKYVIKVGYPVAELDHIFEYGFKGGLLKVERQVQDDNIRNMLLGRGGEKNLPYRYFKDIDKNNPSFPADPDWIPELSNIYFSELRGKTFRDYVKGWKTNPHRQLTDAEGKPIAPYIVTYPEDRDVQTQTEPKIEGNTYMLTVERSSISIRGSQPINVPEGYQGNFDIKKATISYTGKYEEYNQDEDKTEEIEISDGIDISITNITLIDRATGNKLKSENIPSGEYDYEVAFELYNTWAESVAVNFVCENLTLINTPIQEVRLDIDNALSVEPYDEEYAATSWAYKRGHEDEKFDPVEFVKDDASIAKYGELMGGLENNEEIYPSIQGVTVDPYGRIDEVVDVEEIKSDDIEANAENDSVISNIPNGAYSWTSSILNTNDSESTTFPKVNFTVPAGQTANLRVLNDVDILKVRAGNKSIEVGIYRPQDFGNYAQIVEKDIKVYDSATNKERSSVGLPEGSYYYVVEVTVKYISAAYKIAQITVGIETPKIQYRTLQDEKWGKTWDIWVKNIWGSEKRSDETDAQYAERVWRPILGDRTGEEAKVVFSTGMLSTSEDYEFVIAKTPVYDTSHSLNGVPSHWKLTLGKSDADLESTGLYLPSTMRQGKAGDHFFFIGIDMPHQYVVWAEERLDNYKMDNLDEVKDIKPTWVVRLDKIRISNQQQGELKPLISQLHVGDSFRLADKRFITNEQGDAAAYEVLYLQSITYNYNEPSSSSPALIPDVEVVLSDKYETIANPIATLSGEVSALSKQIGSIPNVEQVVRAVGDKLYLRKDGIADRSMSPTEFFSLVKGRDFRSGIVGGASWGIYQDANGNWVIEADKFKARQELEVNNLVINQIIARGGMIIESAAQIEVTRVMETADGYVCYFDQHDGTVANLFHVDDVAYCNRFTPENTELKFYKRRVMAVSADSITLKKEPVRLPDGKTEDVNGSGIPEVGDTIIQYGNYTDPTRRYVKVRDVIGGGYERYLEGLDSVNASGKEYYFVGKQDGQNPRWFIGYSDKNYAEWKNGNLYIKGNIDMTAGSSLQNVEDFKNLENKVDNINFIGRNLLFDTKWFVKNWDSFGGVEQSGTYLCFHVYYADATNIASQYIDIRQQDIYIEKGTEYTLSFYAKGEGSLLTYVYPSSWSTIIATNGDISYIGGYYHDGSCGYNISNEWTRYFVTFRTSEEITSEYRHILFRIMNGGYAYICGAKLEKGSVMTDWSPAPEDVPDDLRFVTQIFPDGVINNSATVSQLLAVKDSPDANANIVAGIYGGGAPDLEKKYGFLDTKHRKLMIFSGAENLGSVANAATRIYEDGTIITEKLESDSAKITKAEIENSNLVDATISGTIKSPFQKYSGSFELIQDKQVYDRHDNLSCSGEKYQTHWSPVYNLSWDSSQNGRTITLVNYQGGKYDGPFKIQAKENFVFFEKGQSLNEIVVRQECVVLKGFGEGDVFYGWIVVSRAPMPGYKPDILYEGIVENTRVANPTIVKYKSWDGKKLTVSRQKTGSYFVYFPDEVTIDPNNYTVMLTGWTKSGALGVSHSFGSIYQKQTTFFEVLMADDDSLNDSGFTFQILNTENWTSS